MAGEAGEKERGEPGGVSRLSLLPRRSTLGIGDSDLNKSGFSNLITFYGILRVSMRNNRRQRWRSETLLRPNYRNCLRLSLSTDFFNVPGLTNNSLIMSSTSF